MANITRVMAGYSASITEFKANPNDVIRQSKGEPVAVLKSNEPCFYAVSPVLFESMSEAVEDLALLLQANKRMSDGKELVDINLDEL